MLHAWQMCDTRWDRGTLTRVALRVILCDALILTILTSHPHTSGGPDALHGPGARLARRRTNNCRRPVPGCLSRMYFRQSSVFRAKRLIYLVIIMSMFPVWYLSIMRLNSSRFLVLVSVMSSSI